MNDIILWVLQVLLGAMFIFAGLMKATQSKEKLARMAWTHRYEHGTIKFIGIAEALAGIGLIAPWATGFVPVLTPIAAGGIALIMILAAMDHIKYNEKKEVMVNIVIFLLAVFVAFGRYKTYF